ncbi:MAG: hypothetical protein AAGB04_07580 [Pseudomonadota bacterium]
MTSSFESPEEHAADQGPSPSNLPNRIRQAMAAEGIEHYSMSLVDSAEIAAVIEAVNIGIDAHLTACFCPDRGDSYQHGDRSISATFDTKYWKKGDQLQVARTLECSVSAESLPVLLRRLDESDRESAWSLRSAILATLSIED